MEAENQKNVAAGWTRSMRVVVVVAVAAGPAAGSEQVGTAVVGEKSWIVRPFSQEKTAWPMAVARSHPKLVEMRARATSFDLPPCAEWWQSRKQTAEVSVSRSLSESIASGKAILPYP